MVAGTAYIIRNLRSEPALARSGEKASYPDGAYVLLGDRELPRILAEILRCPVCLGGGGVSALEESAELAKKPWCGTA